MAITFHFLRPTNFVKRKRMRLLLEQLFTDENKEVETLDIIFCSDPYLLQINQQYLAHDYFTDIITFDLSNPGAGIVGEIYISVDTAKTNAKVFKTLLDNELSRLIIHGALHLCGYTDKKSAEKRAMTDKENQYLSLLETI